MSSSFPTTSPEGLLDAYWFELGAVTACSVLPAAFVYFYYFLFSGFGSSVIYWREGDVMLCFFLFFFFFLADYTSEGSDANIFANSNCCCTLVV